MTTGLKVASETVDEFWCQAQIFSGESCLKGPGMQIIGKNLAFRALGSDRFVSGTKISKIVIDRFENRLYHEFMKAHSRFTR